YRPGDLRAGARTQRRTGRRRVRRQRATSQGRRQPRPQLSSRGSTSRLRTHRYWCYRVPMGTESRRRGKAAAGGARPSWRAPLDDPRDEEILSAAFDVFCEKGFHGATMLDVATQARASKETL